MQKIIIDNFRQISHAEIEVRDFLFLIGEQASGKSTIAKLIYFFRSIRDEYSDLLEMKANDEIIDFQQELIHKIQDRFRLFFGSTAALDDTFRVQYYYSFEKNRSLTLSKVSSLKIEFDSEYWLYLSKQADKWVKTSQDYRKKISQANKERSRVSYKGEEMLLKRRQEVSSSVFCDKRECLFMPAGRNITVAYPDQFQRLFFGDLYKGIGIDTQGNSIDMRVMRDFVNYAWLLRDYYKETPLMPEEDTPFDRLLTDNIIGILHGKYLNEEGKERMSHDSGGNTPLNRASSGQQEAIRLIQDAMYILNEGQDVSRIIEEPESHLFPTAQKKLIQLLIMVANKTGSQLIITTHSPHVMATFNNLLYYTRALQKEPGKRAEIEKHFGTEGFDEGKQERLNILVDKFQAYALSPTGETYCHSIFDSDTHLIGENYIDKATEEIYDDADFLYSLLY